MREELRSGSGYLRAVTQLLQRIRVADPTSGLYEAAELQWWWRRPRRTDDLDQLFWFDDDDQPVAAAVLADFGSSDSAVYDEVTLCQFVMPDASADVVAQVFSGALAHAAAHGFDRVELEVSRTDAAMHDLMEAQGFGVKEPSVIAQGWLEATARPHVSELAPGYRLATRAETVHLPHHMADRNGDDVEARLQQTSLYRPDLDLVVLDEHDATAAYGMFWYDPVSATGVVEPMRTIDEHQRRGLARHVLTAGIDRLAQAGALRISIGWEPDNPASGHLYRRVGFVPDTETDLYSGPTRWRRPAGQPEQLMRG